MRLGKQVKAANAMRKALHAKKGEVRVHKEALVDELMAVMADFEKRKAERLVEISTSSTASRRPSARRRIEHSRWLSAEIGIRSTSPY